MEGNNQGQGKKNEDTTQLDIGLWMHLVLNHKKKLQINPAMKHLLNLSQRYDHRAT
jgi:hypothetical protein